MLKNIIVKSQYQDDGVPPASKTLIAVCTWNGGLGYSRTSLYYISGSKSRKEWRLWIKPGDPEVGDFWFNAVLLQSEISLGKREAATMLIYESWRSEWSDYETPGNNFSTDTEGILDSETLKEIAARAFIRKEERSDS